MSKGLRHRQKPPLAHRRLAVTEALRADPGRFDRSIARDLGVSHELVARVRLELSAAGEPVPPRDPRMEVRERARELPQRILAALAAAGGPVTAGQLLLLCPNTSDRQIRFALLELITRQKMRAVRHTYDCRGRMRRGVGYELGESNS
jgi:hypothetical protein